MDFWLCAVNLVQLSSARQCNPMHRHIILAVCLRSSQCMQGHQASVPLLPAWLVRQAGRPGEVGRPEGWLGPRDCHTVHQEQPPGLEEEPDRCLRRHGEQVPGGESRSPCNACHIPVAHVQHSCLAMCISVWTCRIISMDVCVLMLLLAVCPGPEGRAALLAPGTRQGTCDGRAVLLPL